MRLMGGGNLNVDNEKMLTTLIVRKTTDNGKIPESIRCQHPYITRMRQKKSQYQSKCINFPKTLLICSSRGLQNGKNI